VKTLTVLGWFFMKLIWIFLFIITIPLSANADVLFRDDVVLKGKSVMLVAETRGRFFKSGGEIVEFLVESEFLGRSLSGGDGMAYREFTPKREGLYEITVKSGEDDSKGLVLSIQKDTEIVFIDVAGGLFESIISRRPREGSKAAVDKIIEGVPVVYLNMLPAGKTLMSDWLKKNGFPSSPLLGWEGGDVFSSLVEKGFRVKAVIGSPEVIASAKEFDAALFTFQNAEDATEVSEWKEIEEVLTKK
jgi:hypothetical protein